MARILVVEDESILRQDICDRLRRENHEVVEAGTGESGIELATLLAPDVVLSDLRLPGVDGLAVLREVKRICPRTLVVLLTAHGSERTAVDALRDGAYDYLTKPVELRELVLLIERAVSHCRALDGIDYARESERLKGTLASMVGVSANIRDVKNRIRQLASSTAMSLNDPPTVLITGETGTGKDLVAHAIHNEGPRKSNPFVHVNCTAVSETLFESELFGHLKGSFTGAHDTKKGLFQVAEGGTIFLDEVGHLGPAMQAKLLLTLEKRTIRPVGATDDRSVNVQIVGATNRDLQAAIAQNEYRADLFHRLRVVEIHLQPLRERIDDILPLAETFLQKHARRFGKPAARLSAEAASALKRHDWPGNVRELSHAIESALLTCDDPELTEPHLRIHRVDSAPGVSIRLARGGCIEMDFERGVPTLDQVEAQIIQAVLEYTDHNVARAARILGLTRETLRYRLNKTEGAPQGLGDSQGV